ncbi:succinate dehydrogenase, hydrophobic membrane anchor protein [Methylocystis heyeri]|uniref:Succinate dehydrogenase hydrophobic membrane anchor subunit n=1 Tax=Methylocystis heyeri TaxID=391905 RepID=A0A6B8KCK6_9HYPH|nr:succinate dehydrogenase, hydrophobic membrane anchor protein [Methylocystis heyeri]QGM44755.1 succinate dehydrogenase, hydrophobic membrane anchor protein [Methylocystis heyeri]
MTSRTQFVSGRTGQGAAYVSDRSGSPHDKFMRRSSYALAPLGLVVGWLLVSVSGKSFEAARAEIGRPIPALAIIAFIAIACAHMRLGAESVIIDYVHDPALKEKALVANKWASLAIASVWTLAVLIIAAPK